MTNLMTLADEIERLSWAELLAIFEPMKGGKFPKVYLTAEQVRDIYTALRSAEQDKP